MDLKDKAAAWLKSNWSLVVGVIGLILLAINNSWVGLALYAVVIHILCVSYICGLYDKDYLSIERIKALAKQDKVKIEDKSALGVFIALSAGSIVVLVARDHWYLLIITIATIVGISIHIIDGLRRIREYRKAAK